MSIKTKENQISRKQNNKPNVYIILATILLVLLIMIVLFTNKTMVLDKVGKIFNVNGTNKAEETLNNGEGAQTVSTANWDLEKVNIVYDKDNVAVPVPKGYVASRVENGVTPIGQEIAEENRVRTGFVIYELTAEEIEKGTEVSITKDNFWEESQKRNQWVWVPVPDPSRIYERDSRTGKAKAKLYEYLTTGRTSYNNSNYEPGIVAYYDKEKNFVDNNMQGMTQANLLEELENEFEATIESIEKYGGFYIGRYETGNVKSGSYGNYETPRQPVVQRMNINTDWVTWYGAYNSMKNIQTNKNVKSNIIWGSLWDETLQWLVDSGSKSYEEIKNSVAWGNHKDSEFDYINASGVAHINANRGIKVLTGSSEQNKANNIYDMAGNAWEWTLECDNTYYRWCRGGACNTEATLKSVDGRSSPNVPIGCGNNVGVRAYFYIK